MRIAGRYAIHFAGRPCGEERWSIERTEAGEVATGEQVTQAPFPFPSTLEWRATLSPEARLSGLEVHWRVGERLVSAVHGAAGGMWRVRIEAQGHVREQEGDYPARAHVVLGAHLFHTFAFRTLVLEPGAEHEFPMLAIGPPWMAVDPGRLLVRCTAARILATPMGPIAARRVEVIDPARGRAEAFAAWIDTHDIVLASHEGEGDALPWMTLVEYDRELTPAPEAPRGKGRSRRMSMLDAIGGTRLVPLRYLVPEGSARILLKLEYENPTGSMKDRMALAMVAAAEADGRLKPGGSVVEYTGGSTGVSLAFVCAAKRVPLRIVTSDAFSREKRAHMEALGARLTLVASPTGGTTKALTLEMIETAKGLAAEPGSYWTNQLHNADQLAAYDRMGDEIWEQAERRVDAFVQMVGTAGSLRGTAARLRTHAASVRIVAVEPAESPVLSGRPSGSHGIEGTGIGFVPPLWTDGIADEIQSVSSAEAMETARRLAREEGVFAGTSTGGNVAVALRVAARLGAGRTVVTVAVDSGMKYLSGALYGRA